MTFDAIPHYKILPISSNQTPQTASPRKKTLPSLLGRRITRQSPDGYLKLNIFEKNDSYTLSFKNVDTKKNFWSSLKIPDSSWKKFPLKDNEGKDIFLLINMNELKNFGFSDEELKKAFRNGTLLSDMQKKVIGNELRKELKGLRTNKIEQISIKISDWISNDKISEKDAEALIQDFSKTLQTLNEDLEGRGQPLIGKEPIENRFSIFDYLEGIKLQYQMNAIENDFIPIYPFFSNPLDALYMVNQIKSFQRCSDEEAIKFIIKEFPLFEEERRNEMNEKIDFSILLNNDTFPKYLNFKLKEEIEYTDLFYIAKQLYTSNESETKECTELELQELIFYNINVQIKNTREKLLAVRHSVMEVIADGPKELYTERINKFRKIHLNEDDNKKYHIYIEAISSSSTTVKESAEGLKAKNNIKAADMMVKSWVTQLKPINLEMIKQLNTILTAETINNGREPGSYRTDLKMNVMCSDGKYLDYWHVKTEVQELCDWVNSSLDQANGDPIKIIEIAARALNWSISIHPFADGNGRTCRFLANYILLMGGLPFSVLNEESNVNAVFGEPLILINAYIENNHITDPKILSKLKAKCGATPEIAMKHLIEGIELAVKIFGDQEEEKVA